MFSVTEPIDICWSEDWDLSGISMPQSSLQEHYVNRSNLVTNRALSVSSPLTSFPTFPSVGVESFFTGRTRMVPAEARMLKLHKLAVACTASYIPI
jgi:hypothetical protein